MAWMIWHTPDIFQENDFEMMFSPIPFQPTSRFQNGLRRDSGPFTLISQTMRNISPKCLAGNPFWENQTT